MSVASTKTAATAVAGPDSVFKPGFGDTGLAIGPAASKPLSKRWTANYLRPVTR